MTFIRNCLFKELSADNGGAIFYTKSSDLYIKFVIFVSCSAKKEGGGLYASCNSLYIASSCFYLCFSASRLAFIHKGNTSYRTICNLVQASSCYSTSTAVSDGCTILSRSAYSNTKNINMTKNSAPHISGFQSHLSPNALIEYSIFADCVSTVNGVLIQFHTATQSSAQYLIIKNNSCPSSAEFAIINAHNCNGYIKYSSFIENVGPCLISSSMTSSFCYASKNTVSKESFQNSTSSLIYFRFYMINCALTSNKRALSMLKYPLLLYIVIAT